ncbi:MAG: DEAD/DEAH box helicase [Gemmataceae bacterium]
MLREEQIDIRRQRAVESKFRIKNIGRNRIFSDFEVANPATGGRYRVSIRSFEPGDNSCACPDFKTNTLGTCKHIEAVLTGLREDAPPAMRRRKASVARPEVFLHYGEQLQIGLHLPPRPSDKLRELTECFFDKNRRWQAKDRYDDLIEALDTVAEEVTIFSDAMEFMDREIERREMGRREKHLVSQLDQGKLKLDLLKVPLYSYQLRGALFAAFRGRCILGDDMGLGKTVQTMAAAELLARERNIERVLVVAPASVKYQWETEIRKFTDRPVQVIEGGHKYRRALYGQPTFYRLVNYESVLRDVEELNAWQPDLIVLDEAQRIKNWEAKTSRAVKQLRSRYALVLTGTPLENKIEELYSIVQFVDDRRLGPAFQFLNDHRVIDDKGKLLGYRNLDRIREKLEPILLRRTRAEVLKQLPARTDNLIYVEMTSEQRAPYDEQKAVLGKLIRKKYLTEVDRRRILCCLTNMRMLCDSSFLYDKVTNFSPKLVEFAELMRQLLDSGPHKAVVFSQWELMLRKTAEVLDRLGIGYVTLHGGVPGKDRRKLMERFREDPDCLVFLSTDAGGTGLNLQSADTVVNLEVPWNPAVLEQRVARVHRLGQHRPVQVFNLVTRDSIEERVLKTLSLKRSLFQGIFAGTANEVSFEVLGRRTFLDTVRDMVAEEPVHTPKTVENLAPKADPRQALVQTGVQLLEALAQVVQGGATSNGAANGKPKTAGLGALVATDARTGQPVLQLPMPSPELLQRGASALQSLLMALAGPTTKT